MQGVARKIIFPYYRRNLHDILRNEKHDISVLKKKKRTIRWYFLNFSEMEKYGLFWAKKLMEMWYLLITEMLLFRIFQEWEIRSSFEPNSWCKDDIYWLLKMSFFELFGDGKYGLFSAKKLIERWYYLIFLSFPWYSGTFSCSDISYTNH